MPDFIERRSGDRRSKQRRTHADNRRGDGQSDLVLDKVIGEDLYGEGGRAPTDDRRRSIGAAYLLQRRLRGDRRHGEGSRATG